MQSGLFPVLFQSCDMNPVSPIVFQSVSGEVDIERKVSRGVTGNLIQLLRDFNS